MATVNKGETLIEVKGLRKHFGKLQVLRGIDEQIHAGDEGRARVGVIAEVPQINTIQPHL